MSDTQPLEENYVLGDEIARGGMGNVLVAEDRKLSRRVALKAMSFDAFADPAMRRRFVREARVLAQLAHPNIVPIYDMVWEQGVPQFYTMKLVQGRTLQSILDGLREGDRSTAAAYPLDGLLAIFLKVCDAVAFAHSQGVFHRDLKPANVMVGEFGEVLVMDWGLAGRAGDACPVVQWMPSGEGADPLSGLGDRVGSEGMELTMDGVVMGTPHYMSPEQAQGKAEEIDALSDVYSLGGMLLALLTLRPPVEGDSAREVLEKLAARTEQSSASGAEEGSGGKKEGINLEDFPGGLGQVPRGLSPVIMKAMARDRGTRYPSVSHFAADVHAFRGGYSTSAGGIGWGGQLFLLMKRHRAVTGLLILMMVLSLGFVIKLVGTMEAERRAGDSERRTAYSAVLAQALAARQRHDLGQARRLLAQVDPELRGFDWRLLSGLCRGDETHSFPGSDEEGAAAAQCFTLVPGGERMAVLCQAGWLRVLDREGTQVGPRRRLPGFADAFRDRQRFHGLAYSPGGGRLAYAHGDCLKVVDARTLTLLHEEVSRLPQLGWLDENRLLFGFNGSVDPPPFPEAGAWILRFSGGTVGGTRVTRTALPELCAPLAVSPDGAYCVLQRVNTSPESWERGLYLFEVPNAFEGLPPPLHVMPGRAYPGVLGFSATGKYLAFTSGPTLRRWVSVLEVPSGRVVFHHEFPFTIHGLAMDQKEHRLALVGDDSVVRLYDFSRGGPSEANTYDDAVAVRLCQPVSDGFAHGAPMDLGTRTAQDGRAWFLLGHESRVVDVVFQPGGELLTLGGEGTFRRWPAETPRFGVRIGHLETTYPLTHPAASADGSSILHAGGRATYLLETNSPEARQDQGGRLVALEHSPLAVLPDGSPVTQEYLTGDVVVWSPQGEAIRERTRMEGRVPFRHDGRVRGGVLSANASRLVGVLAGRFFCADLVGQTLAWSGEAGGSRNAFAAHDLSPDGEWIATSDVGGRARVYAFANPRRVVAVLKGGPRGDDTAVRFSRNGRRLYVGNEDGHVRVWETGKWREQPALEWPAHLSAVTAIAVSHDGALLATSGDHTLKLFSTDEDLPPRHRGEQLSLPVRRSANWIQFARGPEGQDEGLLFAAPGGTLERWMAEPEALRPLTEPTICRAPLRNHGAVRLPDGKVLVAGGEHHVSEVACVALSDCYLFDPDTGQWSVTGSMRTARSRRFGLTLLPGGEVLAAGGTGRGGVVLAQCEIYDPISETWRPTESLPIARWGGACLLLPSGQVMAVGGRAADGTVPPCHFYDPNKELWTGARDPFIPPPEASFVLLPNGNVLAVGGYRDFAFLGDCMLYEHARGAWRPTGSTLTPRVSAASPTLIGGEVLIAGGSGSHGMLDSCELYDPEEERWRLTEALPCPRTDQEMTALPGEKVLVSGGHGEDFAGEIDDTWVFDGAEGSWREGGRLARARVAHTSTLLEDGRVLLVGGKDLNGVVNGVEMWGPSGARESGGVSDGAGPGSSPVPR